MMTVRPAVRESYLLIASDIHFGGSQQGVGEKYQRQNSDDP